MSAQKAESPDRAVRTTAGDALEVGRLVQGHRNAVVLLTMGQQGIGWIGKEAFWLPPIPAAVVDATGAGDAVAAVAIFATLTELAPQAAARLVLAAAAMTVTVVGATYPGLSLQALHTHA